MRPVEDVERADGRVSVGAAEKAEEPGLGRGSGGQGGGRIPSLAQESGPDRLAGSDHDDVERVAGLGALGVLGAARELFDPRAEPLLVEIDEVPFLDQMAVVLDRPQVVRVESRDLDHEIEPFGVLLADEVHHHQPGALVAGAEDDPRPGRSGGDLERHLMVEEMQLHGPVGLLVPGPAAAVGAFKRGDVFGVDASRQEDDGAVAPVFDLHPDRLDLLLVKLDVIGQLGLVRRQHRHRHGDVIRGLGLNAVVKRDFGERGGRVAAEGLAPADDEQRRKHCCRRCRPLKRSRHGNLPTFFHFTFSILSSGLM